MIKSTSFWLNRLKMRSEEKNTVNKSKENGPEKLNKLLITDYAKVKNKEQKRWQPHANHDSYTFRHFNEQGCKFSMITTGISSHVHYLLEEKGVQLLSLSLLSSEELY